MTPSTHKNECKTSYTNIIILLLVLVAAQRPPTATGALIPAVAKRFYRSVFPEVRLTIKNDLEQPVMYMCSLGKTDTLQVLWPKGHIMWTFREMVAPIHWCYFFQDERRQGFLWVFRLMQQCTDCYWMIKENGPNVLDQRGDFRWRPVNLHIQKETQQQKQSLAKKP